MRCLSKIQRDSWIGYSHIKGCFGSVRAIFVIVLPGTSLPQKPIAVRGKKGVQLQSSGRSLTVLLRQHSANLVTSCTTLGYSMLDYVVVWCATV